MSDCTFPQKNAAGYQHEIHLKVNPSDNPQKVKSIDYLSGFKSITGIMTKLQRLLKQGVIDKDLLRSLPGMKVVP